MRFLSVCSGIEAASVAWSPLGWSAVAFAEIEPFPCAVLAHRWPGVENLGDFTQIQAAPRPDDISLLVGGTPCQSFSVAGRRLGLDDPRGNLALEFLRLAQRVKPRWVVFENVPGLLSSGGGRDLGAFLGALEELGYGWAYRVLDAQFFGLAQRRKRLFVVGHRGDWRRACAVLLEPEGLRGDSPPSREPGQEAAYCLASRTGGHRLNHENDYVVHTLRSEGFDASEDGTGRGRPMTPVPYVVNATGSTARLDHARNSQVARCIDSNGSYAAGQGGTLLTFNPSASGKHTTCGLSELPGALKSTTPIGLLTGSAVRYLTPRECERLMGFPDDYTLLPAHAQPRGFRKRIRGRDRQETLVYLIDAGCTPDLAESLVDCPDGPRYSAVGNSMPVPVMRWIGRRIDFVEGIR